MPKIYNRNCDSCHLLYVGRGMKYCSQSCYKRQPYTQARKNKTSVSLMGIKRGPFSLEHRTRISNSKKGQGHMQTPETRLKISKSHMGVPNLLLRGDRHPRWKGGITSANEKIRKSLKYRNYTKDILKRDNYTCVLCGKRGGILHVDHIKPFAYFPELRFDLKNGRTLCVPCHKTTESYPKNLSKKRTLSLGTRIYL